MILSNFIVHVFWAKLPALAHVFYWISSQPTCFKWLGHVPWNHPYIKNFIFIIFLKNFNLSKSLKTENSDWFLRSDSTGVQFHNASITLLDIADQLYLKLWNCLWTWFSFFDFLGSLCHTPLLFSTQLRSRIILDFLFILFHFYLIQLVHFGFCR